MIRLQGARTHNLKNIDLDLPRDKLIVITGLSGSGKSSLAFDTIYAEGQRRYVESLSAYARQFLSIMDKPDIDHIEGLSPAISIEQKSTSHNPRSTVGTITEIHDYLRLLFARVGTPYCPTHHTPLDSQTISQMVDTVLLQQEGTKLMMLAPIVSNRKGEHIKLLEDVKRQGFVRLRINHNIYPIEELPILEKNKKHTIEIVIDRFKVRHDIQQRLTESFETALNYNNLVKIAYMDDDCDDLIFSSTFACTECGYSLEELEPRMFSFNSPNGACPSCDGLGVEARFDPEKIVVHPYLSMSTGAIRGWDKNAKYYFKKLSALAEHYHFSLNEPFETLPKNIQDIILFGSGDEDIEMIYITDKGREFHSIEPFEGIIPNIERRYKETESNFVREELSKYQQLQCCHTCNGTRLNQGSRHVLIESTNLPHISNLSIADCHEFLKNLSLQGAKAEIADKILKEINQRLLFLINVGLNYLSLSRSAETLSGGEAQRIRLASQIGAGLVGVMYVLDEPSIGLHQRDNDRLLNSLFHLRDLGNTVIVVEHDEDAIRAADYIVDIGPGAGIHGGDIVAKGTLAQIQKNKKSLTAQYLNGQKRIEIPKKRTKPNKKWLSITGASGNNLKSVSVKIPVGLITCVTGVSGSGKSTLVNETISKAIYQALERVTDKPAAYEKLSGQQHFDKIININQSPIGRTPRSNPATYTQIFTAIRELFAGTEESRARGYTSGRFSFNVKGGRCEACQGDGVTKVEMHFLPDVYVACDICKSKKYNRETLDITYKGKNIFEILQMTVEEALSFFDAIPAVKRRLQTLMDVGLLYITLGQNATTLSGGEAQRIKLSKELSKRDTGKTLYILDEPTTGLHFHDVKQLLHVLHRLRDHGNTLIVIEHNLDVIKTADWVIDLGPEGGEKGGEIVISGTPETVAKCKHGYTGQFLKRLL
ncbi:MAG: excinuclease ABC subunit UvrA [Ostreibacterium sp.]